MIASYLHDLGKLAIPAEILEKPAKLTPSEFAVIQSHPYHSRRILESVPGFEPFADWAASHHEHLDGSGYPYHTEELSQGARLLAVADVFTAVTENRPYRDGMDRQDAQDVLAGMADANKLDRGIVGQLLGSYGEIDAARREAQSAATERYNEIYNVIALSGASA
jgi:HD-GYP domain-containing protein (c-di-GMP phosphodiesterase class II)